METSNFSISFLIKNDKKLLTTSVRNLTTILQKLLPPEEYSEILEQQQNRSFWRMPNLQKFYEKYLEYWNENRLKNLN
ncbi:hypothetical protein [Chryseobacterium sp.]|uniref:hypothetical protein n=1 Tax=Chryseobacterium sp. TaxID=1871047 RepID=UPI002FCCB6F3